MRKFATNIAGFWVSAVILLSPFVLSANASEDASTDNSQQVILRFLRQPTTEAINGYYGERRQYWRQEILCIKKETESPYYEVVLRAETFHGAHNPPYGLETLTFYVDPLGQVQLAGFEHQDEP